MQWGDYTTLPSHGPPFHRGALYQKATTVPPEARYVGLAFSQSPAEARGFTGHTLALEAFRATIARRFFLLVRWLIRGLAPHNPEKSQQLQRPQAERGVASCGSGS
jgi:hypothetical protein